MYVNFKTVHFIHIYIYTVYSVCVYIYVTYTTYGVYIKNLNLWNALGEKQSSKSIYGL